MFRYIFISLNLLAFGCSESESRMEVHANSPDPFAYGKIHLDLYIAEATKENNCATIRETNQLENIEHFFHYESLVDFENRGFADITIENISSSKKLLVFILAHDKQTGLPVGKACLDNVHVEKDSERDIHISLIPPGAADEHTPDFGKRDSKSPP